MNQDLFVDCIERAVGPVRASGPRKARMREELAAHLAASWEEERARVGDESEAALRAIRRLGDIDQLGRDLRDSVPRLERWLFTPLLHLSFLDTLDRTMLRRADETPIHHALRVTIRVTAAITGVELILVPMVVAMVARPGRYRPPTLPWAVASIVVVAAGSLIFPLLCDAMIRALRSGTRGRLLMMLHAASSSLVVMVLGLTFVLIVSLGSHQGALFEWSDWPRLFATSLLGPPCVALTADSAIARRSRDGWRIAKPSH
jgi:hypothetical protein